MKIESQNKALGKELLTLRDLLVENGAWFDKGLGIICDEEGSMSVQMVEPKNQGEEIIRVPQKLLVPMQPLHISLKGDSFSVDPDKDELTPIQIEVGKRMIEIYNITGKAALTRSEYPWYMYRDSPELMDSLLRARSANDAIEDRQSFLHGLEGAKTDDEFICDSFIKTRVLGQKDAETKSNVQIIMPIIDYLNHDARAGSFMFSEPEEKDKYMKINNAQPFIESRECYVVYGIYDMVDTFFNYGFPDANAPIVRSIPMDIEVRDVGTFSLKSLPAAKNFKKLGKQIEDLRRFMPIAQRTSEDTIELTHLIIPITQSPHALRRILRSMIRTMAGESVSSRFVVERVYEAEDTIISKNIEFYNKLRQDVAADTKSPEHLKSLIYFIAETQYNKLLKYRRDETMLNNVINHEQDMSDGSDVLDVIEEKSKKSKGKVGKASSKKSKTTTEAKTSKNKAPKKRSA